MKKYEKVYESVHIELLQQQYEFLQLFQYQLRNSSELNDLYLDKGLEIADGLQPWIDVLDLLADR